MFSPEVLSRLSELNRLRLPTAPRASEVVPPLRAALATPLPASPDVGQPAASSRSGSTSQLPQGRALETQFGSHWLIEQPVKALWPDFQFHWDQFARHRDAAVADAAGVWEAKAPRPSKTQGVPPIKTQGVPANFELEMLQRYLPHSTVFLDLETCGLGGSMTFLVGLLHQQDEQLVLSQLLARNYAEEKAVLASLWQIMTGQQVLVTFNGKSFDWPMVHDRSTMHHLGRDMRLEPSESTAIGEVSRAGVRERHDPRPNPLHCDLLHHARRRWRGRLPNCKLQTLEQYLCGRRRTGDIPGYAIPAAYHEYVRTGDAWQMRSVLHHNALDLVTLLQLSMRCVMTPPRPAPSPPSDR
jgi:uncharacterized protein YprB with RNaseH-like and TPR domain